MSLGVEFYTVDLAELERAVGHSHPIEIGAVIDDPWIAEALGTDDELHGRSKQRSLEPALIELLSRPLDAFDSGHYHALKAWIRTIGHGHPNTAWLPISTSAIDQIDGALRAVGHPGLDGGPLPEPIFDWSPAGLSVSVLRRDQCGEALRELEAALAHEIDPEVRPAVVELRNAVADALLWQRDLIAFYD